MPTEFELKNHLDTVRERLAGSKLSVLELRREIRARRSELLEESDPELRSILASEIEMIDTMADEASPPPPTPQELVEQLLTGSPDERDKGLTLGHALARRSLLSRVSEASQAVNDQPTSDLLRKTLADAQAALATHDAAGPPPLARQQRIRELRDQMDSLPEKQQQALVSGDIDRSTELAQQLLDATAELNQMTGTAPAAPAANDEQAMTPDQLAIERAEQAVTDSMAREAADKAAADLIR